MLQIMETTEIPRVIWGASSSEMSRVEKSVVCGKGSVSFEARCLGWSHGDNPNRSFWSLCWSQVGSDSQVQHMLPVCVISWAFDKTSVDVVAQWCDDTRGFKRFQETKSNCENGENRVSILKLHLISIERSIEPPKAVFVTIDDRTGTLTKMLFGVQFLFSISFHISRSFSSLFFGAYSWPIADIVLLVSWKMWYRFQLYLINHKWTFCCIFFVRCCNFLSRSFVFRNLFSRRFLATS